MTTRTTTGRLLAALLGLVTLLGAQTVAYAAPTPTDTPPDPATPRGTWPAGSSVDIVTGLTLPWGLVQLGDGTLLFTSSDSGEIRHVTGVDQMQVVGTVPGINPAGEGGLLGLVQDPKNPGVLYTYASLATENQVIRLTWDGRRVAVDRPVITGIPHGGRHDGGRVAFGPDDQLYVTTGEIGQAALAQDLRSLGGKILRVDRNGNASAGNPFAGRADADARIWSWGHRNVEGLDWDSQGRLWSSELGENTWDEINIIRPGANYGWPTCEGPIFFGTDRPCDDARFTRPEYWRSTADMSPSGVEVMADNAYVAALRGRSLWEFPTKGGTPRRLLQDTYGRLRTPLRAGDGRLFLMTSNGSGTDRIVLVDPKQWKTAIIAKWESLGATSSKLGSLTSGEYCGLVRGGCFQRFQGGNIYWTARTGAHPVWGRIFDRWAQLGYEKGQLGYPTSDEICGLKNGGCYQRFEGGWIYWSPASGAYAVWGRVFDAYAAQRFENGPLGYPTSAEFCGLRGGGCFQRFQGGSIYWSPATGAWPVRGAIRDQWGRDGWENGPWGYPTGVERCEPRHCWQPFGGGVIHIRW